MHIYFLSFLNYFELTLLFLAMHYVAFFAADLCGVNLARDGYSILYFAGSLDK